MSSCCAGTSEKQARCPSRISSAAGWILPAGGLALIPKCPACIAAYVAIASGVGISIPTASLMRTGFVLICASSLSFAAIKLLSRQSGWRRFRRVAVLAPVL